MIYLTNSADEASEGRSIRAGCLGRDGRCTLNRCALIFSISAEIPIDICRTSHRGHCVRSHAHFSKSPPEMDSRAKFCAGKTGGPVLCGVKRARFAWDSTGAVRWASVFFC